MRLHRLELTNVKGVAQRQVEFPERGVVVLEGRNEIGKTSMVEALDLLLDEKDSSRKRHVLAVRPVGRDVASSVEAEVSSGPYRFTYRKQWFKQPGTTLTITSPRVEHLTGVAAHERVRDILARTTDLELWRALRLMQATPLSQCDLGSSSALAAALDAAAGRAEPVGGAENDTLLRAVEAEYRRYFTATGKETGEYRDAAHRIDAAQAAYEEAQAAVDEVTRDLRVHARLVDEVDAVTVELDEARADLARLEAQWRQVSALLDQREQARGAADTASAAADLHVERRAARAVLAASVDERRRLATAAEQEVGRLRDDLTPHERHLAEVAAGREAQELECTRLRHEAARAEADLALLSDLDDLAATTTRLDRLDEALERRAAARREAARRVVDGRRLDAVATAHQQWQLAVAEQRAASAAVQVTALSDGQLVTVAGQSAQLSQGECVERSVEEDVEVVVGDAVRVSIRPEAGAAARAEAVARARAAYDAALAEAGAESVDDARHLHELHRRALAACRDAELEVERVLHGQDADELREQRAALAAHVDELTAERSTQDLPGDAAAVRAARAAARAGEEQGLARLEALDAQVRAGREATQSATIRLARCEAMRDSAVSDAQAAADELQAARERRDDDSLQADVERAQAQAAEASAACERVAAAVREHDPEAVKVRLDGAQAAVRALTRRHAQIRDERVGLEARLALAGSQGRAERRDAAASQLDHARREYASIHRRARAAAALQESLLRHRDESAQAYVEPFGAAITRLGRVVYGPDFGVEVSRGLCIEARILDGERIDYAALSTGAKEQLAILTRLACASLVDPEQGAPVVIDDALGYSDPEKLRRVCSAFSLAGDEAQVLLLTCTPGRYASIPDAHVIRL